MMMVVAPLRSAASARAAFAASYSPVAIDVINRCKALWDWTTRTLVGIYGSESAVRDDAEGGVVVGNDRILLRIDPEGRRVRRGRERHPDDAL